MDPNISRSNLSAGAMAPSPALPQVMVDLMHPAANVDPEPAHSAPASAAAASGGYSALRGSIDGPIHSVAPASVAPPLAAAPPTTDDSSGLNSTGRPGPSPIPQPAIPIDFNSKPTAGGTGSGGTPPLPPPPVPPIPMAPPPPPKKSRLGLIIAVIIVLLLIAATAAYFFFFNHSSKAPAQATQTPVSVASPLSNFGVVSGQTVLPDGSATNQSTPSLSFKVNTSGNQGTVTPEIEVEPLNTPFTGTPTVTGQPVSANGSPLTMTVPSTQLSDGPYHWQARIQVASNIGPWTAAGTDPTKANFIIDTVPPAKPTLLTVDQQKIDQTAKAGAITTAKPVIIGKSDPGTTVNLVVQPENINFPATVDASGNWTATPASALPNGTRDVTVTATDSAGNTSSEIYHFTINAPVAIAATPTPTPSATPSATPTPTPAATPAATPTPTPAAAPAPTKLAATGDPVALINLSCLGLLLLSGLGWVWLRRARLI